MWTLLATLLASCADEVAVTQDDFGRYRAAGEPYGYIQNAVAPTERLVDLYRAGAERMVTVGLTRTMDRAVDMKVTVDESVLADYNRAERQNFPMFPAGLVSIAADGSAVVPPGSNRAQPLDVAIAPSDELVEGTTYVIPLRVSTDDPDVKLTPQQARYLFYVTFRGDRLDAAKASGLKVVSCMETGDADPRIHCELMLANEGKPLVDIVVLFSGNLNYNTSTGRVYVHMNTSIGPILRNRERYLKPLQDMGIKVVLGLLGNYDAAGVGTLEEQTALQFVDELKNVVQAYGLDGVFWDDEYTSENPDIPGFSYSSSENASRLLYETKRAMPDKLNIVYLISRLNRLFEVDGVQPGEYVDYMIADYGMGVYMDNWPGATKSQGMPYPYELARGMSGNPASVVSGGWGGIMVFALSEHRTNWEGGQLVALRNIARTMFDDELAYTGKSYPVEW